MRAQVRKCLRTEYTEVVALMLEVAEGCADKLRKKGGEV